MWRALRPAQPRPARTRNRGPAAATDPARRPGPAPAPTRPAGAVNRPRRAAAEPAPPSRADQPVRHRRRDAARRPVPAVHPGRVGHRGRGRVLAGRGHRAAARRRGHRAAPAGPRGRRDRWRRGPDRRRPGRRDGGARAALGQLRAHRLRPAAGRAGPRGLADPGGRARRRGHRVGGRPQPGRAGGRRHDPPAGRGPRGRPAGRGGRGGAPARPGAGLRPPAADPDHPGRARAAELRAAPAGRHAGRRRARPRAPSSTRCSPRAGRCRAPTRRGPAWPPPSSTPRGGFVAPSRLRPGVPDRAGHPGPGHARASRRVRPRAHRGRRARCCSTTWWPRTTGSRCSRPRTTACRPAPATCGRTATGRPRRPTRSAGATWPSGCPRSAWPCCVVLGYLGIQLTSVFSDGGRPAIVVSGTAPQPPAGPGDVARAPPGRPAGSPARRSAARRSPPASRCTTAPATGTTTVGSPG